MEEGEEIKNGYAYLLRLQVRTLTANKIKELKNDIEGVKTKLENIKKLTEKQIWLNELEEFKGEYDKWLKNISSSKVKKTKK